MPTDPVELEELIETTKDYLEDSGRPIVLSRSSAVRKPSGQVVRGEPVDRPVQVLVLAPVTADPRLVTDQHGQRVEARFVLIGMPDADIEEQDEFRFGPKRYRVGEVHPERDYETRAWVLLVG